MTSLRDLVASLNRDFPIDVTARVMGRLRMRRGVRPSALPRLVWLRAVRSSPRAALAAGIAAGLLLSVTLAVAFARLQVDTGPLRAGQTGINPRLQRDGLAAGPASRGGRPVSGHGGPRCDHRAAAARSSHESGWRARLVAERSPAASQGMQSVG